METIIEEVKNALLEVLEVKVDQIRPESKLFEELNLDSTSVLELLMVLEDRIEGLSIDPEDLEPKYFETVESLATYVQQRVEVVA